MMTIEDQLSVINDDSKSVGYKSQKALENYENHRIEWNKVLARVKEKVNKKSSLMDRQRTIQFQLKNIEN